MLPDPRIMIPKKIEPQIIKKAILTKKQKFIFYDTEGQFTTPAVSTIPSKPWNVKIININIHIIKLIKIYFFEIFQIRSPYIFDVLIIPNTTKVQFEFSTNIDEVQKRIAKEFNDNPKFIFERINTNCQCIDLSKIQYLSSTVDKIAITEAKRRFSIGPKQEKSVWTEFTLTLPKQEKPLKKSISVMKLPKLMPDEVLTAKRKLQEYLFQQICGISGAAIRNLCSVEVRYYLIKYPDTTPKYIYPTNKKDRCLTLV